MATSSDSQGAFQALADIQQQLLAAMLKPLRQDGAPFDATTLLQQMAQDYARDPERWQASQQTWYQQQLALWTRISAPQPAQSAPTDAPAPDRRFRAPEWREPYFQWLSQSYLITSRWLTALASGAELKPHEKKKSAFLLRQWIDAASPANFAWSNPESLKLAAETQGASLAQGLQNLRDDMPKGMVSMTDETAFEVGRNLAVTPGAVVFENEFPEPQKRIYRTTVTICVFDLTRTPYGRVLLGFCCVAIWLGQIIGTVVPPSLGPPFWSCQVPDH